MTNVPPLHRAATDRAVEAAARGSYGRLVAMLAAATHDVAAAEDALGEAFAAALVQWPVSGVPDRPEAWLLTAAQRRVTDGWRRAQVRAAAAPALVHSAHLLGTAATPDAVLDARDGFPDRRLGLLFACAHPAIDPGIRTPLMLQAVLGLDADRIAAAFLTAPSAMAQRLVRAKRKLRDAGVPFEVPSRAELPPRLDAVLEAIYSAFGTAWDAIDGGDAQTADLADEAIWLARLVVDALPNEPEARGLLALLLYCHARRDTRRDAAGAYVPLAAQQPAQWARALIGEAESALAVAARQRLPGRFQLEAAIQSAHLAPAYGRPADAPAIAVLYDALTAHAPTIAVLVNRAAAHGAAYGAAAGLAASDAIDPAAVRSYQPWWALRAHLFARLGRDVEARAAYETAIGLTESPAVRAFLNARRDAIG